MEKSSGRTTETTSWTPGSALSQRPVRRQRKSAQSRHRDADLGLAKPRRLFDLDGRGFFPLRQEDERLGDVPRKARLDQQVHQGLVPSTEADFPARLYLPANY